MKERAEKAEERLLEAISYLKECNEALMVKSLHDWLIDTEQAIRKAGGEK